MEIVEAEPGHLTLNRSSDQLSPRTPPAIFSSNVRAHASIALSSNLSRPNSICSVAIHRSSALTLSSQRLTNPFSCKPFVFTSIQNPRVSPPRARKAPRDSPYKSQVTGPANCL